MKKYYVMYVNACAPSYKSFDTMAGAKRFATLFLKQMAHNRDDNWVDYIWYGQVMGVYDRHWEGLFSVKTKAKGK